MGGDIGGLWRFKVIYNLHLSGASLIPLLPAIISTFRWYNGGYTEKCDCSLFMHSIFIVLVYFKQ